MGILALTGAVGQQLVGSADQGQLGARRLERQLLLPQLLQDGVLKHHLRRGAGACWPRVTSDTADHVCARLCVVVDVRLEWALARWCQPTMQRWCWLWSRAVVGRAVVGRAGRRAGSG